MPDAQFDLVLMVTAVCFFTDVDKAFREARRVLKDSGSIVVAFIDAESAFGRLYQERKASNEFYADATFYSVPEITARLSQAGFTGFGFRQTVFGPEDAPHPTVDGYGTGGFVVIKARPGAGQQAAPELPTPPAVGSHVPAAKWDETSQERRYRRYLQRRYRRYLQSP